MSITFDPSLLVGAQAYIGSVGIANAAAALETGALNPGFATGILGLAYEAATDSAYGAEPNEAQRLARLVDGVLGSDMSVQTHPDRHIVAGLLREQSAALDEAIKRLGGERLIHPTAEAREGALISSLGQYEAMYDRSIQDPEGFWGGIAEGFKWSRRWDTVREFSFAQGSVSIEWFKGGKTNICVNCLDRHVDAGRGGQTALIWEGNEPGTSRAYTYGQLLDSVCQFANVLKEQGVKRGDRVTIYMPMVPELPIAMLACARIGAIHSVVFGGFTANSIAERMQDAGSSVLVTADGGRRGPKEVPLKHIADDAMTLMEEAGMPVKTSIVFKNTGTDVTMKEGRDIWWHEAVDGKPTELEPEVMDAEDPLFILYTSGSTGKPKGVVHTTGGYMVGTATTHKYVFDIKPDDVYWCTADIGWVTGHSYIVYGPLANGTTTVMFEGIPTYPEPSRFWQICARHRVTQIYTAPTALRILREAGDRWTEGHDLSKLRVLGTVGEPIDPSTWRWYHERIGEGRKPIVDTWWMTETGMILITPLPGATPLKPGSATLPFFGVKPVILAEDGRPVRPGEGGFLAIEEPWPAMARTVYGDHNRFEETYFNRFPGRFFTSDGARMDHHGYMTIRGRVDDVIIVSGHNLGTGEIESHLMSHEAVAATAVVGYPHDLTGNGLYAFVVLQEGVEAEAAHLRDGLNQILREKIGPVAKLEVVQVSTGLPQTRSGKTMRRVLRLIVQGEQSQFGDLTSLNDPGVVTALVEGRRSIKVPHLTRDAD